MIPILTAFDGAAALVVDDDPAAADHDDELLLFPPQAAIHTPHTPHTPSRRERPPMTAMISTAIVCWMWIEPGEICVWNHTERIPAIEATKAPRVKARVRCRGTL